MEAFFILLAIFVPIAAIFIAPFWFREQTKQSAHRVVSQALERGTPIDPAMMEKLTENIRQVQAPPPDRARRTLGNGIVMLALAGGFMGASYLGGDFGPDDDLVKAAVILGALGVAFTLLAIIDYASKKKEQ